ncbi:ABC transporter substrate-binding protein [Aquabacterium sp. OR-4]|uniref:ABC transporter substrate-binding protein n=1 Tax=Aquabacterium sp. OR-4 TaxID=2978127 RepID=UPI0021B32FDD|nr:ABC transporter substrate-binding protein [Aquabacterium sp. OR-4]MDT7835341.1 ABC transporter substrate-binding protein [Aquabacterium sp. OR-4]
MTALPGWPALARMAGAQAAPAGRPLRIVGPWEITGLEPAIAGHFFTRLQVCETLVEADDQGRLQPGLASAWTLADDGLHWRFRLREGARFHDGTPVTAAQVAQVLQRAHQQPGLLRLAPLAAIEPAAGATGNALLLRLREPFALLPALLAHSSTLVLGAASRGADGRLGTIIGSGPYRIHALTPPQQVQVQAMQPGLPVQQAHYLNVSRAETRALMAEAGQADMALALDPASLQRLGRLSRLRVAQVTVPRTLIMKLNAGHRWLRDPRARRALSLALDRGGIARGLLRDGELAATQLLPPTLAAWHQPGLAPLRFDPAAAARLWAELGWQRGRDGLLQRDGDTLRLTLRSFPDRPELPLVATAVQEQLRQTGIDCRVLIGNSGEVPLRHRDGSLELALAARHYALVPDPLGTLLQDFGAGAGEAAGGQGGDWGAMGWHSPALQQALTGLARGQGDAPALRAQAMAVLHDELPVIPIAWYRQSAALAPALAELALDPLERSWRLSRMPWPGGRA